MHPLTSYRSEQWRYALGLFLVGLCFLFAAFFMPGAMVRNVYGNLAYDIEAEAWAGAFMSGAGLVIYGLHINGRWKWSPLLRMAGYVVLSGLFATIAASAFTAPDGIHLVIFVAVFFGPLTLFYLAVAARDMVRRLRLGKSDA